MVETKEADRAVENGRSWMENISEMVLALEKAVDNSEEYDKRRDMLLESPLSVRVRTDWYSPGEGEQAEPCEFEILLSTGGPAVRLIGYLDERLQPRSISLEHQDWGTPWTALPITGTEEEILTHYAQQFYFGEG